MKRIKIAFVASTFTVGGAERVLGDLITRLAPDRFDVRLYFLREAGTLGRELFRSGHKGAECLQRNRFDVLALPRLIQHFRGFRPDLVFCLDHHNAMLLGRAAGIATGVGTQVVASHSTGLFGKSRNFTWADRLMMDFTDRVIAVSPMHAEYLCDQEGLEPGRVATIENGIDVETYHLADIESRRGIRAELGIADDDAVVMMVAALRPEKAHEALIDAVANLQERGRNVHALIVGDGPRRTELEDMVRVRCIDRIQFLGLRPDVARLLHAADVLALPSHPVVETLPISVLEAMASGVPVVASRVGSLPDMIEDGVTGLLIAPANAVELADGIEYILKDRQRAQDMARKAREIVESRYSATTMVTRYESMFTDLVAA